MTRELINHNLQKLAEKYGVTVESIKQHFRKAGYRFDYRNIGSVSRNSFKMMESKLNRHYKTKGLYNIARGKDAK